MEFAKHGFQIVLASRNCEDGARDSNGAFLMRIDLADPHAVGPTFDRIEAQLGSPPSVVLYNGR